MKSLYDFPPTINIDFVSLSHLILVKEDTIILFKILISPTYNGFYKISTFLLFMMYIYDLLNILFKIVYIKLVEFPEFLN